VFGGSRKLEREAAHSVEVIWLVDGVPEPQKRTTCSTLKDNFQFQWQAFVQKGHNHNIVNNPSCGYYMSLLFS